MEGANTLSDISRAIANNKGLLRTVIPSQGVAFLAQLLKTPEKKESKFGVQYSCSVAIPEIGKMELPVLTKQPEKQKGAKMYFESDQVYSFKSWTQLWINVNKMADTNITDTSYVRLYGVTVKEAESANSEKGLFLSAGLVSKVPDPLGKDLIGELETAKIMNTTLRPFDGEKRIHFMVLEPQKSNEIFSLTDEERDKVLSAFPANRDGTKACHVPLPYEDQTWSLIDRTNKDISERAFVMENMSVQKLASGQIEYVLTRAIFTKNKLDCFAIKDLDAWKRFAPLIFENAKIIAVLSINENGTEGGLINQGATDPTGKIKFLLNFYGNNLISDAYSVYQKIGIKVSRKFLETNQRLLFDPVRIVGNLTDYQPTADVICLSEFPEAHATFFSRFEGGEPYEIRAIFQNKLRDDALHFLSTEIPTECGDNLLLEAVTGKKSPDQKWREKLGSTDEKKRYTLDLGKNPLIYFFVLFPQRRNRQSSIETAKEFVWGLRSATKSQKSPLPNPQKEEQTEDNTEGNDTQPQKESKKRSLQTDSQPSVQQPKKAKTIKK